LDSSRYFTQCFRKRSRLKTLWEKIAAGEDDVIDDKEETNSDDQSKEYDGTGTDTVPPGQGLRDQGLEEDKIKASMEKMHDLIVQGIIAMQRADED
jgi:hypothetical protein